MTRPPEVNRLTINPDLTGTRSQGQRAGNQSFSVVSSVSVGC